MGPLLFFEKRSVCTSREVGPFLFNITEARAEAEPASWNCCEAKSEGFERGSVREIGLCDLWEKPCCSAGYPYRQGRSLLFAQSARSRLPPEVTLSHFWGRFQVTFESLLDSLLSQFGGHLFHQFLTWGHVWITALEPDEFPLHFLSSKEIVLNRRVHSRGLRPLPPTPKK